MVAGLGLIPSAVTANASAGPYFGYRLALTDDFKGRAGTPPNPAYWYHETGGGGWGNNEQQIYTNSTANSRLNGQGMLSIRALREGSTVTSARINTHGKINLTYGVVEARIKLPTGQGIHPAFWALGANIYTAGWPECGEIDIVESINQGSFYHVGVHGPTATGGKWERGHDGSFGSPVSAAFHRYGMLKKPGEISFLIDGRIVKTVRKTELSASERWVFDAPFHLLLNVAVGGNWPGPIGPSTTFPAEMLVDWVRVYK